MNDLTGCITRSELCDILKISPKTSRRLDRDGIGPKPIRVTPRITRYALGEVVEFMHGNGLPVPAELLVGASNA